METLRRVSNGQRTRNLLKREGKLSEPRAITEIKLAFVGRLTKKGRRKQ